MKGRTIVVVLALTLIGIGAAHADGPKLVITATDANGKDTQGSVTISAGTTTTIKWNATGIVPGSCSVLKDDPSGPPWTGISQQGEQVTGQFTEEFNGRKYTLQCTSTLTNAAVKSNPVTVYVSGSAAPKKR